MSQPYEGSCQCGAVRYKITSAATVIYACHCNHCQTQSGSAFGLSFRLPGAHFQLTKDELKTYDRQGDTQIIRGSFCADCGTRIHHTLETQPNVISLKPGTLDDTTWLPKPTNVWVRGAQPWVAFPDGEVVYRKSFADGPDAL